MLEGRTAMQLTPSQLDSVALGVSHCIEQQYGKKIPDDEFRVIEGIVHSAHNRIRRICSHSGQGMHLAQTRSRSRLPDDLSPNIELESDYNTGLRVFVDKLLQTTSDKDENGCPVILANLTRERRRRVVDAINESLTWPLRNELTAKQRDSLKELADLLSQDD